MKIIGVTGGSGSGKSIVCKELKKNNCFIIDCDSIAHSIILKNKPAYKEIVSFFGNDILDDKCEIIRKKLGEIVFNDTEKLNFLNNCTHKYIIEEIKNLINLVKKENVLNNIIIDAPLLIEANIDKLCDEVWLIYCDENTRLKRIVERDNISYDLAKKRIVSQKKFEEYKKYSDIIIDNSKDIKFLRKQILRILNNNFKER